MATVELLLINFLFGLISAFSPCLFPLLPSYVAVTLQSKQSRGKIFLSSLFLVAGLMVVFLFIGSISNLIGRFLLSNYSLFAKIQGTIIIIAGLLMIKTPDFIYSISLPDRIEQWLFDEEKGKNRPFVFSFILGLVFTIIAAPCAAGSFLYVISTLIGEVFLSQFLLVLSFGLGVGLPFMLMSLFLPDVRGDVVGKMHSATSKISAVIGVILVIAGFVLIFEILPRTTQFI